MEKDTSWLETYFEVVSAIAIERAKDNPAPLVEKINTMHGTSGFYELAENLTNDFEAANKDREWDGDFFDTIDAFMRETLNNPDIDIV